MKKRATDRNDRNFRKESIYLIEQYKFKTYCMHKAGMCFYSELAQVHTVFKYMLLEKCQKCCANCDIN